MTRDWIVTILHPGINGRVENVSEPTTWNHAQAIAADTRRHYPGGPHVAGDTGRTWLLGKFGALLVIW